MAINVIIDDANDRQESKMNTTMSFVLDSNHCYQQKSKNQKRHLSAIYALDHTV